MVSPAICYQKTELRTGENRHWQVHRAVIWDRMGRHVWRPSLHVGCKWFLSNSAGMEHEAVVASCRSSYCISDGLQRDKRLPLHGKVWSCVPVHILPRKTFIIAIEAGTEGEKKNAVQLSVNVFSRKEQNEELFLRLVPETGPPFYVAIQARLRLAVCRQRLQRQYVQLF